MNNYGESSVMTWRHKCEGELRSNRAAATQNCLENTTADIWEYRTHVNGTVSTQMVFP